MQLSPEEADHILLKCPSDIGIRNTDRKGTLNAPEKLLKNYKHKNVFIDEIFPNEFDLHDNQERIRKRVKELLEYNKPIVSIGGDHSISYPLIDEFNNAHDNLHLIWIDAHYDLKAIRVERGIPHDSVVRGLMDHGFSLDDILFMGVRERDPDEEELLLDTTVHELTPSQINGATADDLRENINTALNPGSDPIYVSLDIDVIDPDIVPATTYPSDNGLFMDDIDTILSALTAYNTVGWDLVEVAPPLHPTQKTQKAATHILETLLD